MPLTDAFLDGGNPPTTNKSFWQWLFAAGNSAPDSPALIVSHQQSGHRTQLREHASIESQGNHLEWTFRDLELGSRKLAAALKAQGVSRGDKVVTFVENGVEWALFYLAVIRLELTLASLDAEMTARPDELASYIKVLDPRVVVVKDDVAAHALDASVANATVKIACDLPDASDGWIALEPFALAQERAEDYLRSESEAPSSGPPRDLAIHICFTSGTTAGIPKGCARSYLGMYQGAHPYIATEQLGPSARYLIITVPFRIITPTMAVVIWAAGGTLIFPSPRFNPDATVKALVGHKCTNVVLVPALLRLLALHPAMPHPFPKTMNGVLCGGDIVNVESKQICKKLFGDHIYFEPAHGMTEAVGIFTGAFTGGDDTRYAVSDSGIFSLGRVSPGIKVRISASPSNSNAKVGETGELHICGDPVIDRYLEDSNPQDFYDDEHGRWLKTGDLGMVDEEGNCFILGREKDVIKYQGISLGPAVLEVVLNREEGMSVS